MTEADIIVLRERSIMILGGILIVIIILLFIYREIYRHPDQLALTRSEQGRLLLVE